MTTFLWKVAVLALLSVAIVRGNPFASESEWLSDVCTTDSSESEWDSSGSDSDSSAEEMDDSSDLLPHVEVEDSDNDWKEDESGGAAGGGGIGGKLKALYRKCRSGEGLGTKILDSTPGIGGRPRKERTITCKLGGEVKPPDQGKVTPGKENEYPSASVSHGIKAAAGLTVTATERTDKYTAAQLASKIYIGAISMAEKIARVLKRYRDRIMRIGRSWAEKKKKAVMEKLGARGGIEREKAVSAFIGIEGKAGAGVALSKLTTLLQQFKAGAFAGAKVKATVTYKLITRTGTKAIKGGAEIALGIGFDAGFQNPMKGEGPSLIPGKLYKGLKVALILGLSSKKHGPLDRGKHIRANGGKCEMRMKGTECAEAVCTSTKGEVVVVPVECPKDCKVPTCEELKQKEKTSRQLIAAKGKGNIKGVICKSKKITCVNPVTGKTTEVGRTVFAKNENPIQPDKVKARCKQRCKQRGGGDYLCVTLCESLARCMARSCNGRGRTKSAACQKCIQRYKRQMPAAKSTRNAPTPTAAPVAPAATSDPQLQQKRAEVNNKVQKCRETCKKNGFDDSTFCIPRCGSVSRCAQKSCCLGQKSCTLSQLQSSACQSCMRRADRLLTKKARSAGDTTKQEAPKRTTAATGSTPRSPGTPNKTQSRTNNTTKSKAKPKPKPKSKPKKKPKRRAKKKKPKRRAKKKKSKSRR